MHSETGTYASGGRRKHKRAKRYSASAVARKREEERCAMELADLEAEAAEGGICFYDSEFGMYNYGDRQGDVVLIGACVAGAESELCCGSTETDAADSAAADVQGIPAEQRSAERSDIFNELIRNTEDAQLAERFTVFTGLRKEDLYAARPFPEVYADFCAFVRAHQVRVIYCLGNNDIERLGYMLERYQITDARSREVLSKFRNFQKWLTAYDRRISGFSLESLAALCNVTNERAHDALSDAQTLRQVWEYLSENRFSDARIAEEIEAAHQRSRYKKSRRITFEKMPVSAELLAAKNLLVSELRARNRAERYVSAPVLRAICDDLDALLTEERTDGSGHSET